MDVRPRRVRSDPGLNQGPVDAEDSGTLADSRSRDARRVKSSQDGKGRTFPVAGHSTQPVARVGVQCRRAELSIGEAVGLRQGKQRMKINANACATSFLPAFYC
jgi:hypothetical protein